MAREIVREIAPESVVTFECPEGFTVAQSFGIVRGEAQMTRNVFASTMRSISSLIGLTTADCLTDAERARGHALAQLRESAELLGANGVVKLRFAATEEPDGMTRVRATGEAVLLDPAPA